VSFQFLTRYAALEYALPMGREVASVLAKNIKQGISQESSGRAHVLLLLLALIRWSYMILLLCVQMRLVC
jgi:hypothetical protein